MAAFASVKQKLFSIIDLMDSDHTKFVYGKQHFTRIRKISFKDVLLFLLFLEQSTLKKELLKFFSFLPSSPSCSAMFQQRAKIKPYAFQFLLRQFTSSCQKNRTFLGYHLLAVDGSDFSIPENPAEQNCHFKKKENRKGYNLLHVNTVYNVMDKVYEAACIQPGKEKNEHQAMIEMLQQIDRREPVIFFADRGYESYNTFAHILEKNWDFLIRGRQGKSTILSGLSLPEGDEEFDETITVTLTNKAKKKGVEYSGYLKRLWSTVTFDFLDKDHTTYPLTIRVVRIKVTDQLTEVLYTSLPKEKVSAKQLGELYAIRWGIETSYRKLKYTIGAAAVHSKKEKYVSQEIYAKIILYNCCEILTGEAEDTKEQGKKDYQIDFSMASNICRHYLKGVIWLSGEVVKSLIQQYQEPVRKGRSYPRNLRPKSAIDYRYRIP